MAIIDFFNSIAIVKQLTTIQESIGGIKKDYGTTRIASLPCRLSNKNIAETDEFGKKTMREGWRLYCSASAVNKTIVNSDRVIVGGRTFEVVGIYNPALLDRHLQIDLLLLE